MTTPLIDELDDVPQVPGGPYVNHVVYGTALGAFIALATYVLIWVFAFQSDAKTAWGFAAIVVTIISATKKTFDYTERGPSQGETLGSCIAKAVLTPAGTAIVWYFV
jgi:hypothetical protein